VHAEGDEAEAKDLTSLIAELDAKVWAWFLLRLPLMLPYCGQD
jgi:hypothetical protein